MLVNSRWRSVWTGILLASLALTVSGGKRESLPGAQLGTIYSGRSGQTRRPPRRRSPVARPGRAASPARPPAATPVEAPPAFILGQRDVTALVEALRTVEKQFDKDPYESRAQFVARVKGLNSTVTYKDAPLNRIAFARYAYKEYNAETQQMSFYCNTLTSGDGQLDLTAFYLDMKLVMTVPREQARTMGDCYCGVVGYLAGGYFNQTANTKLQIAPNYFWFFAPDGTILTPRKYYQSDFR